jgi:hypothetical protein
VFSRLELTSLHVLGHSRVVFCNTVFRVALYASVDIKAGTELFFHYNYPEDMTKNFKQPKGKVVAVKQTVKAPIKVKPKRAMSCSSTNDPTPDSEVVSKDRPWIREALAKARAAKAAKRAAMLAEKAALTDKALPTTSNTHIGNVFKQARKSASGPQADNRGRSKRARELDMGDESNGSRSASRADDDANRRKKTTPAHIVQDTDEEEEEHADNKLVFDAEGQGHTPVAEEGTSSAGLRRTGRSQSRTLKSAPVVAVKKLKSNMGGARPGAGRKRKRIRVSTS